MTERTFFAPGRVNLIGEHTDYNGGHVLPCALTLGTYGKVRLRDDDLIVLSSENAEEGRKTVLPARTLYDALPMTPDAAQAFLRERELPAWTAYPVGVIAVMAEAGYRIPCGIEMEYSGNLPNGAGLSSSASLEVLTGFAVDQVFGFGIGLPDLAKMSQRAENEYAGVACGIMDQFAAACGQENTAVFLDTNTMEYQHVPLLMDGYSILIANTNVKHSLVSSAYNDRRRESSEACEAIRAVIPRPVRFLGDLTSEEFEEYKDAIRDPVVRRRGRHAVYENLRTIEAVSVLGAGDLRRFGELMYESHASLRDDYEVSCPELDVLVEAARGVSGVIGSRMTGGGFGGCTVSIVSDDSIDGFIRTVGTAYLQKTGLEADFYTVRPGAGPHEIF